MLKRMAVLVFCLSLAGCFEDKGTEIAECQLKYARDPRMEALDAQGNVMLCMRTKGYKFEDGWTDSNHKVANLHCYEPLKMGETVNPGINSYYDRSSCYHKIYPWTEIFEKD